MRTFCSKRIKQKQNIQTNVALSSRINFDRLPIVDVLDINDNGIVIIDPNNPVHQRWLED